MGISVLCFIIFSSCKRSASILNTTEESQNTTSPLAESQSETPEATMSHAESQSETPEATSPDDEVSEVQKIIDDIMPKYYEVEAIFYGGFDELGDEILDENRQLYSIIESDKYKSLEDIFEMIDSVYTDTYRQMYYQWATEGEYSQYKEIDGMLCQAHADAVSGMTLQPEIVEIVEVTDLKIVVDMICDEGDLGPRVATVVLLNIDGKWLIDSIEFKE
jgi:hypothetical protein